MPWQEIKGSDWYLPARRNWKTKLELIRPLSKAARDVLNTLPRKSAYVFAGRNGAISNHGGLKVRFDKDSDVTGWRLHDLRRTARSLMSRAGVPSDHAELYWSHVLPGIRATYDIHPYLDEKRAAFEALAKLIRGYRSMSALLIALSLLSVPAHAEWCSGIITSNGTCIGSRKTARTRRQSTVTTMDGVGDVSVADSLNGCSASVPPQQIVESPIIVIHRARRADIDWRLEWLRSLRERNDRFRKR